MIYYIPYDQKIIMIMDYLDKYDKLVKLLTEEVEIDGKKFDLKEDFEKFFIRGNKTAGTIARKTLQDIRNLAKETRD
jgi:hypothetical protein